MYRVNPATGQLEDENGNPVSAAPADQVAGMPAGAGQPIPPAAVAAAPVEPAQVGPLAPPATGMHEMSDAGRLVPVANPIGEAPSSEAAAGAAPSPAVPAKRVEGVTTSTTRTKISKEEEAANQRRQAAEDAGVGIAGREGKAIEGKATADQAAAAEEAKQAAEHARRLAEIQKQWHGEMQKADAEVQKAVAERAGVKLEKFGEGDPAWKNIGRALAIGLSELGAGLAGTGHNTALESIRDQEKEHYMLQRSKIEEADKKVQGAKENRQSQHDANLRDMADLERERYINNAALAAKAKEAAASAALPAAKVIGEKIANEAEQRAAAAAQSYGALKRVQIESRQNWSNTTGGADAAGGAGQGRAAGAMQQRAQMTEKGQDALKTADRLHREGVFLDEKDRKKLQDNETDVEKVKHFGPVSTWIGRNTIYARNKYEGLDPKKQELAQAYDVLSQIGSSVTSQSHDAREIEHGRELFDLNAPGMGDVARVQTYNRLRGIVGAAGGLSGPYIGMAQRGAAAAMAAPGVTSPAPGASSGGKPGGQRKLVNGKPAILYPDGSYDYVQ